MEKIKIMYLKVGSLILENLEEKPFSRNEIEKK